MIFLIITLLFLIHIQFGLFVLLQIIIWLLVLFISNTLLGLNPNSKELHIIRIISIIILIFIIYNDTGHSGYLCSLVSPISVEDISYLDEFYYNLGYGEKGRVYWIFKFSTQEISKFLEHLDKDETYLINMEFIPSLSEVAFDNPQMFLSRPFLVNSHSSTTTITKHIHNSLELMVDTFYLDDTIIQKSDDGPIIFIHYAKVIFN